jgi:hypothetical protein
MADLFLFPCYFRLMRSLEGRLMPGTEETGGQGRIIRLRKAA